MKKIIVFTLCVALVYSQYIPPSQNPPDATFFSTNVTNTLTFETQVNGTIYNTTGSTYNEYWKLWIPTNVSSLRLTVTTPNIGLSSYLRATLNLGMGRQDRSPSYSCANSRPFGNTEWMCQYWDHNFTASALTGQSASQQFIAGYNFVPGHWLFVTINKQEDDGIALNYTLLVELVSSCGTDVVDVLVGDVACVASSSIIDITTQGQLLTRSISAGGYDYYRVYTPQNVSRVYAVLVSLSNSFTLYAADGYVSHTALGYAQFTGYTQNITGYNTYFAQVPLPDFDQATYFTIGSSVPASYTIQFFTNVCGADKAGFGRINTFQNGQVIFDVQDCLDSVQYNNMVFAPGTSYSFQVPAYNPAAHDVASCTYGLSYIAGTTGNLSFTCSASVTSWIAINKNMPSAANTTMTTWVVWCNTPTNSTNDRITFLSEDLITGGYYSFAACHQSMTDSASINLTNLYPSPSPSVTPSPSPSAPSTSGPVSSPSASASSSRSDSSDKKAGQKNSGVIIGVVVGISAFGGVVALAVLYKRRRRRDPQQADLELNETRRNSEQQQQRATIGLVDEQQLERQSIKLEYLNDIEIKEVVGAGSFGQVYRGVWKGTQQVALKRLMIDKMDEVLQEATMLQKCDFPNVVKFLGLYQNQKNEVYMVTEFMSGGALNSLLEQEGALMSIKTLVEMARDAACGIRRMADQGMVHRDLAARNLLVHKEDGHYTVKVADFGLARMVSGNYYTSSTSLFPVKWTAPESLKYEKFSVKSDVWSFGVVLWEIFELGSTPYRGMSNKETAEAVLTGYRLSKPKLCPDSVWDLVMACWAEDPSLRPTFEEIYNRLNEIIKQDLDESVVVPQQGTEGFYGNRSL